MPSESASQGRMLEADWFPKWFKGKQKETVKYAANVNALKEEEDL